LVQATGVGIPPDCTQVAGDLVNMARGDFVRGGVGVLIAGALLLYLLGSNIRTAFQSGA
jgi:uncharacterized protein YjeT (DUF2065 family)